MNGELLWTFTALLFAFGVAGTVIPGLPGIGFVFSGIFLYAYVTGFSTVTVPFVVGAGVVALLAVFADYVGSALGARIGGGKWKSILGSIAGLMVGVATLGPIGVLIGALIGAFLGALAEGVERTQALRVALYTTLGIVGSTVVQFVLAVTLIAGFLIALVF
ncbi:MAG: DUF456 domain-containing protein [Candidatus Pacebacteria bacterium]|nr:DUF456 domain-containing protein [Candidatus Paceibacterota bacterium]